MDTIKQIKEIPILQIAQFLGIEVKRNKAMCFSGHDSQSPSLTFTPSRNLFHCFGCGKGGSNIDLVMGVKGADTSEAIKWLKSNFLNQLVDVKIKQKNSSQGAQAPVSQCVLNPNPSIYSALIDKLRLSDSARSYLNDRGFRDNTINKFCIKDITNCKEVFNELVKKYGKEELKKSGLVRQVEFQQKTIDYFLWWDQTILFPFFDQNKQIVYIQGRRLNTHGPKYIGLKGIIKPLYNISIINSLNKQSLLFICEGIPDVLAANEMGFQAVGVLGAHSFKDQWVEVLFPYDIVVIPDNDSAGSGFAKKIKDAFLKKGKIIQVVRLHEMKDLSEYYQKKGLDKIL